MQLDWLIRSVRTTVALTLAAILVISVVPVAFNTLVAPIGEASAQAGGQGQQPPHISFKYTQFLDQSGCLGQWCGTNIFTGSFTSAANLHPFEDGYAGNGTGLYEQTEDRDTDPVPPACPQRGSYHHLTSGPAVMEVIASPSGLNYTVQVTWTGAYRSTWEKNECGQYESGATEYESGIHIMTCDFYEVELEKGGTYEIVGGIEGSVCSMTISPVKEELRIFGTAKGIIEGKGTKPLPNSKVVMENIDNTPYLEALSTSKPDFIKETATSDDKDAKYEFKFGREDHSKLPRILVVSVLWYEGKPEFAVTNGKNVSGTFVPVYQALCVDDVQASKCEKWKKTGSGNYEAEVNFEYGSLEKRLQSTTIMEDEAWEGPAAIQRMMMDSAYIYYNSYLAMKYFESLGLGFPSHPVMIQAHHIGQPCPDAGAYYKADPLYSRKFPSFGDLGQYLEKVEATGSGVYICSPESSTQEHDAPVNREWHELGHYLLFTMYDPIRCPCGEYHAGYVNPSTSEAYIEGFAEFAAVLINEYYGSPKPYLYPVSGGMNNIELDFKAWGQGTDEELAVAGVLWDFHDPGREIVLGHMVNGTLIKVSKVYPTPMDEVSVDAKRILQVIDRNEPKTMVDLYRPFVGNTISKVDLDMIFVEHGFFADIVDRNFIHDSMNETISESGKAPDRMIRYSPVPELPGSNLESDRDASFNVTLNFIEPFGYYDYSYVVDMAAGEQTYFTMPPSYYPSRATITPISNEGEKLSSSVEIESDDYWNYILSNPPQDGVFKQISVTDISDGQAGGQSNNTTTIPAPAANQTSTPPPGNNGGGCLIATAAFGSELTPQVQFLRNFRDNHILSTSSGFSFMNVFNAWYYSFSPQVADYEREQPWLQQTVRIAIYPLLGILQTAEKAYAVIPGEYGSITAGLVASSLIGAVYVTPVAMSIRQVRKNRLDYRIPLAIIAALSISVVASLLVESPFALMITTSLLVLSTIVIAAIFSAKVICRILHLLKARFKG